MNCWTAMVRIVESFNRSNKPWHALGAIALIVALLVGLAVVAKGIGSLLLPEKDSAVLPAQAKVMTESNLKPRP